jgi:hypothetical protein
MRNMLRISEVGLGLRCDRLIVADDRQFLSSQPVGGKTGNFAAFPTVGGAIGFQVANLATRREKNGSDAVPFFLVSKMSFCADQHDCAQACDLLLIFAFVCVLSWPHGQEGEHIEEAGGLAGLRERSPVVA